MQKLEMSLDFDKSDGLIPVVVQHEYTKQVLMLGYMDKDALLKTRKEEIVTFFSRSKNRLWTKGETSGNILKVKSIKEDCDKDALLIMVEPKGPTCHKGTQSCFDNDSNNGFIYQLEATIEQRINSKDEYSYTKKLVERGINKVAQKLGEEAVEVVIEAKDDNKELFMNECADLMYHYLVLLKAKGFGLRDIEEILYKRSSK